MKLLLTSAGITNDAITKSFLTLADRSASDVKVAFIPTAANAEKGNKIGWFFKEYEALRSIGINWIDLIDVAGNDINWKSRLDACDVIYVSGGNTFYLLDQMRKQRFEKYLESALTHKVYVSSSAGSIVMTPRIDVAAIPPGDTNLPDLTDLIGLNYVDFEIEPHCDERRFSTVEAYSKAHSRKIYAIDDQTAIQVVDTSVEIISEGQWHYYG